LKLPDQPVDILAVAAHPDDAEISVGGTLLACRQQGLRVAILDLTSGEPTPFGNEELRQRETAAASQLLGLDWRGNLGLPNRSLEATLSARRQLAGVFRLLRPQVILAHYWDDAHPDHVAASALCDAARFWAKLSRSDMPGEPYHPPHIFYYWSIHLRQTLQPAFVVDISPFIDQKMAAIRCYESQFLLGRTPMFPTALDDIHDRARHWGWAIGRSFGEPFASREAIRVNGLLDWTTNGR
jgi:N-acetylglucosamine malate deacetylase 1